MMLHAAAPAPARANSAHRSVKRSARFAAVNYRHVASCRAKLACPAATDGAVSATQDAVVGVLKQLGYLPAILPGSQPERQQLDAIIKYLEASQPPAERAIFGAASCAAPASSNASPAAPGSSALTSSGGDPAESNAVSASAAASSSGAAATAGASGSVNAALLGSWRLRYASNGTVVTRTAAVQALSAVSALPGCGIKDITQELEVGPTGER